MTISFFSNVPKERKIAEQWDITFCPYIEEPTRRTLSWAVQNRKEAIHKTKQLYPFASEIRVRKILDLTSHMAWLTHPLGYMINV